MPVVDQLLIAQKKRTGGHRAQDSAGTWATMLARRELGESWQAIADNLAIPDETAKTYSKLAHRAVREHDSTASWHAWQTNPPCMPTPT